MKTTTLKPRPPEWRVIDAEGKSLGRLAVLVARHLRGKHRVEFSPHQLCGDHVIVLNAGKIALPPKKGLRKTYYRHTGYPGNMKVTRLDIMLEKKPTEVILRAVRGMLPTIRLKQAMLRRLHIYADANHPYEAQQPKPL